MFQRTREDHEEDEPYRGRVLEVGFTSDELTEVDFLKLTIDDDTKFVIAIAKWKEKEKRTP